MNGLPVKLIKLISITTPPRKRVEGNVVLQWFSFIAPFDWSRKLAPPSHPIRYQTLPIEP